MPATILGELTDKAEEFDVIGIDEGQFFADIVGWCESMTNKGKIVLGAALIEHFSGNHLMISWPFSMIEKPRVAQ